MAKKVIVKPELKPRKDVVKATNSVVSHESGLGKAKAPEARVDGRKKIANKFDSKTGVGLVTGEHAPKAKKEK